MKKILDEIDKLPEIKNKREILLRRRNEIGTILEKNRQEYSKMQSFENRRNELRMDIEKTSAEIGRLALEEKNYGTIAELCGPLGIQDWLLRKYLQALEEDANEILEVISNDELKVRLIPEENERLEVRISDKLGERSYNSYSGGEKFRIDFALRLALSRLLANRSGYPLKVLIIDEGFGSQDEKGLDNLVELLYDIQPLFERIIVITHIASLRDRFPARMVVTNTAEGSKIDVQA